MNNVESVSTKYLDKYVNINVSRGVGVLEYILQRSVWYTSEQCHRLNSVITRTETRTRTHRKHTEGTHEYASTDELLRCEAATVYSSSRYGNWIVDDSRSIRIVNRGEESTEQIKSNHCEFVFPEDGFR